jgi:hypothetical protein
MTGALSLLTTSIAAITASVLAITSAVTAQGLPPVTRTDVSGIVPTTIQEAQELCADFSKFLGLEVDKSTAKQRAAVWKATIACMVADNNAVNNDFLRKEIDLTNTHAFVGTAQATLRVAQLERQLNGSVLFVSLESPVVVGGNDPFRDQDGKIAGYYNTPWGIFPVKGVYTAAVMNASFKNVDYIKVGAIDLGRGTTVPLRGDKNTELRGVYFHDWRGQEQYESIFSNTFRAVSHGCIRVPATFLKEMMKVLTTDSSVLTSKYLMPLEAFPLPSNAQR